MGKNTHLLPGSRKHTSSHMILHQSIKTLTALVGSLAIASTTVHAKPGQGNSGDKGRDKGGSNQSERANKNKGADKRADNRQDKGPDKRVDRGPDHTKGNAGKGDKKSDTGRFSRYNDNQRTEIVEHFRRIRVQGDDLPPGLAKNQQRGKPLPPGWQKKLVPGYRIQDDEWSSYAPVPNAWFPKHPVDPDTRLYYHGDRVVRVYEPLREVIDVIVLP